MKTCIITACTGKYKAHLRSIDHLDVDGYIFGDIGDRDLQIDGTRWTRIKTQYFKHNNSFMEAKYYKCFWQHIPILDKYDVVVWIDATIQVKSLPLAHLDDHDIVAYDHGKRTCTHDEIKHTLPFWKYEAYVEGLQTQLKQQNIDWLSITCFVLHKRNETVKDMQKIWFADNLKYSPQDQVSFPLACTQAGVKIKLLPSSEDMQSHVETIHYIKHKHRIKPKDYI